MVTKEDVLESPKIFWKDQIKRSVKLSPEGLILEFGVATGTTINLIADAVPKKTVYGFDWFSGLPSDWIVNENLIRHKGMFSQEVPEVRSNVKLIIGRVEETIDHFIYKHKEDVGFIHFDMDLYEPTKIVLTKLNDRIKSGTVLRFDELCEQREDGWYIYWREHEYKALLEWCSEFNRKVSVDSREGTVGVTVIVNE